jgi:WD40 repeat protein
MNLPRTRHTATLLSDGKVLVTGGLSTSDYFGTTTEASAEVYDPANNTWTLLANVMTQPRSQHRATLLPDGNVLLTTEAAPPPYSWYGFGNNTAELYEAATHSFIELPYMKAIRVLHVSSVLPDGNVILIGGQQDNIWNNTSEIYDATARTFTTSATMKYIHQGISGVTLNSAGDVLVTGQGGVFDPAHSAERYNAATGTFSLAAKMIQPRQNHTSAISADGSKVLLVGGFYEFISSSGYLNTATAVNAEIYDVATNTFTDIGPLNNVRGNGHSTTALNDGSFLVAGGSDPSTSAEIYTP